MNQQIPVQINIAGFKGAPSSVFAMIDVNSRVLAIVKSREMILGKAKDNFYLITNDITQNTRDLLFSDDDFQEAIKHYQVMSSSVTADGSGKQLVLSDEVLQLDPKNHIEDDGVSERGMKYRINPDITNGHVAVIVACWHARNCIGVNNMMDMANLMADINKPSYSGGNDQFYDFEIITL